MENDKNIKLSKEQYLKLLNTLEKYTKLYEKVRGNKMSKDFYDGVLRGLDLIQPMVEK